MKAREQLIMKRRRVGMPITLTAFIFLAFYGASELGILHLSIAFLLTLALLVLLVISRFAKTVSCLQCKRGLFRFSEHFETDMNFCPFCRCDLESEVVVSEP